jgi:hypothetical protein
MHARLDQCQFHTVFLIKAAARLLLLLLLRAADSDFFVADGRRPRLWPGPDGTGCLLRLEQRSLAGLVHQQCVQPGCVPGLGLVAADWGMLSVCNL